MRRAALAGALACSIVGVSLSVAAAIERTAPGQQRVIFVALSVLVTLAAHGLAVISPTVMGRAMLAGCMVLVAYGHVSALSSMSTQAGIARSSAIQPTAERLAIEQQLAALTARPTAAAAAAKATADAARARADRAVAICERTNPGKCSTSTATAAAAASMADAADTELRTAQRADDLRARLSAIAIQDDQRRSAAAADPAAAALQRLTGLDAASTQAAVMALYAVIVELLAVLLWSAAFPRQPQLQPHHATRPMAHTPSHDTHQDPHHWTPRRGGNPADPRPADQARTAPEGRAHHPHRPEPAPVARLHRPDHGRGPRRRPRSSQRPGQSPESG